MYSTFFKPFPTLETERLILRKLNKSDAEDLFEYCKSERSSRYSKWTPHESVADTKGYILSALKMQKCGQYFSWGIVLKSTGKLIGTCSYTNVDEDFKIAEIGYGISESYYNNGYAKEAVEKILEFGFCTVGFVRMFAQVSSENLPSINLCESVKLKCEGLLKSGAILKGTPHDVFVYGITADDYSKAIGLEPDNEETEEFLEDCGGLQPELERLPEEIEQESEPSDNDQIDVREEE